MKMAMMDLRLGLRLLRKHPSFAVVAVLTFALCIAANTTVFSWIDAVLLRPIPGVAQPQELVALEEISAEGEHMPCAHPDFRDFQRAGLLSGVVGTHFVPFVIGRDEDAQRVFGQVVSANFFAVLGVRPAAGRLFTPEEDRDDRGAYPLAVMSYRLWRNRFGGDPSVVGRQIRVNGHQLTVVGVAAPEFRGTMGGLSMDLWVPLSMIVEMGGINNWAAGSRTGHFLDPIARLRPGVSIGRARAEIQAIAARTASAYPQSHRGVTATLLPMSMARAGAQGILRDPLRILMAVCILVLLIACANVANLLLARAIARQTEFGVRIAIGAGRWRLIRQLASEVLLLSLAGALAGAWLAQWPRDALMYLLPKTDLPISVFDSTQSTINYRVMLFTALACGVAGLLSALMPALYASRVHVIDTLKEGGRSGTRGVRSHHARSLLVVFEVALTAVALIGAGLFVRSFQNAAAINPGFDRDHVLVAHFYLSSAGYTREQQTRFNIALRKRLAGAPGVVAAAYADWVPMWFGEPPWERVHFEGDTQGPGSILPRTVVGPGYFDLMRIPLIAGRDFNDRDTGDGKARNVIIVNEAFAQRFFPGREPLGRTMTFDGFSRPFTVIGVVRNSKQKSAGETPSPYMYGAFEQMFGSGHNDMVYVRTTGDPDAARAILRRETAALDPSSGLYDAMPLTDYTAASLYPQKVAAMLLVALGLLSLVLATLGLYSVMAYAVTERTQEIGIRMALGARPLDVLGMVLGRGLLLTAGGLALGIGAALAMTRLVAGLLVRVTANDPLTFCGAAGFLCVVAAVASYVPARRATRVDPMTALRCQ